MQENLQAYIAEDWKKIRQGKVKRFTRAKEALEWLGPKLLYTTSLGISFGVKVSYFGLLIYESLQKRRGL